MVEGQVDHPVRLGRPALQALQVLERPAIGLRAEGGQGLGAGVGAGEAEHLVAGPDQLRDQGRADESARAGDKHTHRSISTTSQATRISNYIILVK